VRSGLRGTAWWFLVFLFVSNIPTSMYVQDFLSRQFNILPALNRRGKTFLQDGTLRSCWANTLTFVRSKPISLTAWCLWEAGENPARPPPL
jgi:hypothetical protein